MVSKMLMTVLASSSLLFSSSKMCITYSSMSEKIEVLKWSMLSLTKFR